MIYVLHMYNGYYFAIRSGNWLLRNNFLKALAPLFFAYNRHKYQRLIIQNLMDIFSLPSSIVSQFEKGEWTVSLKGMPYSNLAIDEAHECVINRRLKQLTSRPSSFRTVELADFMSYMDTVLGKFESYVFKHNTRTTFVHKKYIIERTNLIEKFMLLSDKNLFSFSRDTHFLCNVFVRNPPTLDSVTRSDLVSFYEIGKKRYISCVEKALRNCTNKEAYPKLKTFTKKMKTVREHKNREKNLTDILSNTCRDNSNM